MFFIYKTPLDKILAVGDFSSDFSSIFRPWGKAEYFDTVTKTWINIADYPKFSESNKSKSFDTIWYRLAANIYFTQSVYLAECFYVIGGRKFASGGPADGHVDIADIQGLDTKNWSWFSG